MKRVSLLLVLFSVGLVAAAPAHPPVEGMNPLRTLQVAVDNVRSAQGTIWVGIYQSEEDFLDREKARLVAVKVSEEGRAYVALPDMEVGKQYALGLFHDVNDNGEFDTNWLGLPAEPWAFSGEPKTRLRLPRFDEVSFRLTDSTTWSVLRLRKW